MIEYSETLSDSVAKILYQQGRSSKVIAFCGPTDFNSKESYEYMEKTIAQIKGNANRDWMVLSYLPMDEPKYSYAWLELARRLTIKFDHYTFAGFPIEKSVWRPCSYHIFDDETVHIGLRKYLLSRGTSCLSSAIMLRHKMTVKAI